MDIVLTIPGLKFERVITINKKEMGLRYPTRTHYNSCSYLGVVLI